MRPKGNAAQRQALDLAQVAAALDLSGVPRDDWQRIYSGLLEMESVALEMMRS